MQFANIKWINDQPFSLDFNDVYYASDNGLQETEYVFITQNDLINHFLNLKSAEFTIIETGFGTGLNFFCTVQHWLIQAPAAATLRFISIERYPLNLADFTKANQRWPQFSEAWQQLSVGYQALRPGINRFNLFKNRIALELWLGDANAVLPKIQTPADVWFLDGFAPAKNADMWSENLCGQIARLSLPGTTFATFTSAGQVRRNLQAVGFNVQKVAGFGKKREMLRGTFLGAVLDTAHLVSSAK